MAEICGHATATNRCLAAHNLFGAYGQHTDPMNQPTLAPAELPAGLLHCTVEAGDVLIVTEATTHAVVPWRSTDRCRRYVRFR